MPGKKRWLEGFAAFARAGFCAHTVQRFHLVVALFCLSAEALAEQTQPCIPVEAVFFGHIHDACVQVLQDGDPPRSVAVCGEVSEKLEGGLDCVQIVLSR